MSGYGPYHLSKAAPSRANSPAREMKQLPPRDGPLFVYWSDKRRPTKIPIQFEMILSDCEMPLS
jgi:hypothetical protein